MKSHHEQRRRAFWRRMLVHSGIAASVLGVSLVIGMWGYHHYEQMDWLDAFVNASMILGGMGPVKTDLTPAGKAFAGIYALYSGLIVIGVTGLLLAPVVHRVMHRVHWDDRP
jgi:hypothetical protein